MSVPSFGTVLSRDRLVARMLDMPEGIIGIAAPAGYGKSVLASQFASSPVFDTSFWVDCSWVTDGTGQLSSAVCSAVDGRVPRAVFEVDCPIAPSVRRESWADALDKLQTCAGKRVCIVLDSLNVPIRADDIAPLSLMMTQVAGASSRLVFTTREWFHSLCSSTGVSLMTRDSLKLTIGETGDLAALIGPGAECHDSVQSIHAMCQGQAALAVVMLRHLDCEGTLPDAASMWSDPMSNMLTTAVQSQLKPCEIDALRLCALLQSGTVGDIAPIVGTDAEGLLHRLAHTLPLFRVEGVGASACFAVHDILSGLVLGQSTRSHEKGRDAVVEDALSLLDASGRVERLFAVIEAFADSGLTRQWLLKKGRDLLSVGGVAVLERAFKALSVSAVICEPELLLLQARILREKGDLEGALSKAKVVQDLADFDNTGLLMHDSLMVQARTYMDLEHVERTAACIREALDIGVPPARLAGVSLLYGYMAACLAALGNIDAADQYRQLATRELRTVTDPEIRARVINCECAIDGLLRGRWDLAAQYQRSVQSISKVSAPLRAQLLGNHSHLLLEMGQVDRAAEVAERTAELCERFGLHAMGAFYASNAAPGLAANGQYDHANAVTEAAVARQVELGDCAGAHSAITLQCHWVLAQGEAQRAMSLAENALEYAGDAPASVRALAHVQLAAGLLYVGDFAGAERLATQVRTQAAAHGALNTMLAADLIGAECAKRMGVDDVDRAWANHAEYIATGSMNWRLAMMIRAFPGMLMTLLEHGIGDAIPRRCLKLILPENWLAIIAVADNHLPEVKMLMKRAGVALPAVSIPILQVRMFGRLEVRLGNRTVAKRDWRKRRARLMLAMLVLEQGNEIARDRISEYLWPEVDVERATNNFYVAWSAMKNAIIPGADKLTKLPYMESSHGLCRAVMTYIDADVSEFGELMSAIREAQQHTDLARLKAKCQRLAEVYKGELLPGDLYDDWFASARDRYRREFGDAMRIGASALIEAGQADGCVALLRKGVEADPWREDLYQLLLRAHITSGQRGAAIDVYLSCRSRLADDLGLDPSAETLRLYEEVLAMEECETSYGSDSSEESS